MTYRGLLVAVALAGGGLVWHTPELVGQNAGSVTGTVTNRQNGQPIPGAQVNLVNTRYGALTDQAGRFTIVNVPAGTYTVVATFLGYTEARQANLVVRAGQAASATFQLEETVLTLQQLVVTGVTDPTAGVKLPFTVSKVTADQLQVPTTNSALASIQGKVAGASVIRSSGQPGEGVQILLRSATAFENDNTPLIVVDGVILSRSFGGTTSDIESLDIENVEIIKGAAAASLYGSRAAAGVVSITTRKGRNIPVGQTRVTSRSEFGKSFIGRQIALTNTHHYRLTSDGSRFADANGNPVTWQSRSTEPDRFQDNLYPRPTFDNVAAVYQPGRYLSNNFSLAHNLENTSFLLSLNRLDEAGTLTSHDGYWRNTGRINVDHRIGQTFSISLTGSHARTWQDEVSGTGSNNTNPYVLALRMPPIVNLKKRDADGNYMQLPDSTVLIENPLWRQDSRDSFEERDRTLASINARWSPIRWLTLDAQYSYDRSNIKQQEYVLKGTPLEVDEDEPSDGSLGYSHRGTNTQNGSVAATAVRQFGLFNTRFTTRASFEREDSEQFDATGTNFFVRGVRDLQQAQTLDDLSSASQDVRANGIMGNLGVDYADKYIVDALVRRDGSSLFGPTERWHTYYRGSAAWRLTQEPWFRIPGINEFKLRYAIGTAGGRPNFTDQYESWSVGQTTIERVTAGNRGIKPQFTTEQEFGLDIIGFNSRASLELVYARQVSKDQIIVVPTTAITGFSSIHANAGEVRGESYEATLQMQLINRRDFSWQLTAVFDHPVSTLTRWERSCFFGSNVNREHEFTCAGQRIGDFWIQTHIRRPEELPLGVRNRASEFQVNDEGYLVWVGAGNTYRDGVAKNLWGTLFSADGITYRWGEPIILRDSANAPKLVHRGKSAPDINFGFPSNIRYKNLSLFTVIRGQLGGNVYAASRQTLYNELRHKDLDQTGKPDELKKPIDYYQRALRNGGSYTDIFLESGTHVKLSELALRYRFTRNQLQKIMGAAAPNDLSVGVVGRNLLTLTNYTGFDPERGNQLSRVEGLGYPHTRTLTATLEITF
jgi:TonB-linked SusC/RagA family outer membrane protein